MTVIKIHRIIEGPFETDNDMWYNLCLVEFPNGELIHQEVLYPTMDEAYEDIKTLSKQINPIEISAVNV